MKRLAVLLFIGVMVAAAGCADRGPADTVSSSRVGPPPMVTVPPRLATPEESVRTYLEYVTLAYRMANSEATTRTATDYENVRIDAYIELNREKGQGIEQRLLSFASGVPSSTADTATVTAKETWEYRYFDLRTLAYVSEPTKASYDATYTVVRQPDGRWLVDAVKAEPRSRTQ